MIEWTVGLGFIVGVVIGAGSLIIFTKAIFVLRSVKCKQCHYRIWSHLMKYDPCDGCGQRRPEKCKECGHERDVNVND